MKSKWTPERVEKLTALTKNGLSASDIARALGGTTRNAVIGIWHRRGILRDPQNPVDPRSKGARRRGRRVSGKTRVERHKKPPPPAPYSRPMPVLPAAYLPPMHIDDIATVTFSGLEPHHCRFGVGDPRAPEFGFCGLHHVPGTPYCAAHLYRCMSPYESGRMIERNKVSKPAFVSSAVVEPV